MSTEDLINIINLISFVLFVSLLAAASVRMITRLVVYWLEDYKTSVILRRDILLFASLLFIFGSIALIRVMGWGPFVSDNSVARLIYILTSDVIGIGALGYWTWAEYFVIGKPGKERD